MSHDMVLLLLLFLVLVMWLGLAQRISQPCASPPTPAHRCAMEVRVLPAALLRKASAWARVRPSAVLDRIE